MLARRISLDWIRLFSREKKENFLYLSYKTDGPCPTCDINVSVDVLACILRVSTGKGKHEWVQPRPPSAVSLLRLVVTDIASSMFVENRDCENLVGGCT